MSSNEACVLKIPKFKHDTFGMCVFATCGLLVQNSLSKELWSSDEIIFLAYSTNSFLCQIYKCAFAPYLTQKIFAMYASMNTLSDHVIVLWPKRDKIYIPAIHICVRTSVHYINQWDKWAMTIYIYIAARLIINRVLLTDRG